MPNRNEWKNALVRPPGESFVNAICAVPAKINVALAREQHAEYCNALRQTGMTVETLPADEGFPDSCFMQDPALVFGDVAIIGRMAAASRAGETDAIAETLAVRFRVERIQAPGTLEGGDVLILGDHVLVGETARTNREGIAQLAGFLKPEGIDVQWIPVKEYLHLLTAATYVGQNVLVVNIDYAAHPAFADFDKVLVPRAEAYAANTLGVADYAIIPQGYPRTMEQLAARGFGVLSVPMSEFYKADGGVSCLSLMW